MLELVASGLENKEIAHRLGISEQAVKEHVSNLLRVLAAPNRAALGDAAATLRFAGTFDLEASWLPFLFRKAPIRIAIFAGPEHRLVAANEEHMVTVQGREDVIGKTFTELYPDIADGQELLDRAYRTGERVLLHERETRYARGEGGALANGHVTVILQPLPGGDEKPAGVAVLSVDITDSVRSRRRVQELETERLAILDQLPSGVVTVDAKGTITGLNATGRKILGVGDEVLGDSAWTTVMLLSRDGKPLSAGERPMGRALRGERVEEVDCRGQVGANGRMLDIRVSAAPLFDEEGRVRGAIAVFTPLGPTAS